MNLVIAIVLGIVAAFLILQFSIVIKMRMKKGKPAPELSGGVGKVIKSGKRSLLYFYSPNCKACVSMTPVIERISRKNKNVYKVNVLSDMATAQKFGVMGTPATVVVEEGIIKEFLIGPQTEDSIYALL